MTAPAPSPGAMTTPAATPAAGRLAVGVGLALALVLGGLHLQYHRHAGALWRDEVNSVNLARLPSFAEVLATSHLDSFPAAWSALLHAWVAAGLGDTDAGLRRLGLLIGLAMIAMLWWTGRRLGLGPPLVALLLFGMSPTTIIYGDEVRGYGLGVLGLVWCVGALWAFVERPSRMRFLAAQAAAVLAAQAYFGNCFLVAAACAAAGAVCLRRGTRGRLAAVLAIGLVAAASMLINLPSVLYAARLSPIEQGSYGIAWHLDVFRHALAPEVPALAAAWAVAALLGAVGLTAALRAPRTDAGGDRGAAAPRPEAAAPPRRERLAPSSSAGAVAARPEAAAPAAGAVPGSERDRALFVLTASLAGVVGYACFLLYIQVRTQYWYYLPLMALLALACDAGVGCLAGRVPHGRGGRALLVGAVALLAAGPVGEAVRVRMTNLDLIAEKLAAEARAGDLIVLFPWHVGITFQRYYRGPAPWMTLPDFDAHEFHLHAEVAEKMRRGDAAVAGELARAERVLRAGGRVWVVGALSAPPAGERPARLAPAPHGPEGWRAAPYLTAWEQQLGALLRAHGADAWEIALPDAGPVNRWERLPLFLVEGWR